MNCDDQQPPSWAGALRGLAARVLGSSGDSVQFESSPGPGRHYTYRASDGLLTIAASDGVSAAVALHHFLRRHCGRAVHWDTALPLPAVRLPDVPETSGRARVRDGYYLNFCTFSYTMPYWDWAQWEREIDWMALHGITMPLAATGHEAALFTAYSRLGMSGPEVREFLGGPGYLPFHYMGCLDSFAGPLSQSWIDSHQELGSRIIQRQRALGMTPVLPAFTGHVPAQLAPERVSTRNWQGFRSHVLHPNDPLFEQVGAQITRAQIELFGTDHLYAVDPFIEMPPVEAEPGFPAAMAAATLNSLVAADPEAIWLMQAWPFSYQPEFWTSQRVRAFLDAIPDDRVILADLWAEHDPQWRRLDGFAGKTWLWCALLNFGGRTEPIGDLHGVTSEIASALNSPNPPAGIGLSMEATYNNPVYFEFVADQLWSPAADVEAWLPAFVAERYGTDSERLLAAWSGLIDTVYDARGVRIFPESFTGVLTARPSYAGIATGLDDWLDTVRAEVGGLLWYRPETLVAAWDRMIDAAEDSPGLAAGPLGHDLVDIGVAVLSRVADHLYLAVLEELRRDCSTPERRVEDFLRVFSDLERLLATRAEFTVQHWEAAAARWASDDRELAVLTGNARRIVTVWSRPDTPELDDYAGRVWSGLVGGYYRKRWAAWAHGLDAAVAAGPESSVPAVELDAQLRGLAEEFLRNGPTGTPTDVQSTAAESRLLYTTYSEFASALPSAAQSQPRGA
ncbi:alpha-N-acetylglucosaminidase [Phytoactinopolyspora alkaliphila]|uniref:Alpha-N-acetylglucosaminidase n=1 Tax=Phytoactinopolyspora alkaliphila TaxID=1783498 RepID=A0A6N9YMP9_9ACTN|nr:alpha-N-acetylglucosaminidase [Phytoactinopolyspora alkaliphila]NED96225.1 alpha-N-acetylglucosaminidase [Phytoactinopolyspora alkaliphila]